MPADPDRLLHRLEWTVIRRLDGLLQGDYRTLFRGFGLEFADLREYQYGDDVRHIDWNVTARMPVPFVREYVEDRDVTAWFLLDLSPSMNFGTTRALKRSMVVDFVAVIARLLTRHGNRVGAIVYRRAVESVIAPGSGRAQVLRLVAELQKAEPGASGPITNLSAVLEVALSTIRRRSLIFVVSDFISSPGWERSLGTLAQRNEVLAIRIHDPREASLPEMGPLVMQDAETGEQLYVDTADRRFRQRFSAAVQRREQQLAATFASAHVDTLALSTEGDLAGDIVRFALARKWRLKSRSR